MSAERRDWDRELAEIDKMIASQQGKGPTPAPAQPPARREAAPAAAAAPRALPPAPRSRRAAWLAALLAVAASAAMTQWPWAHACGLAFLGHVAAAAGVMLVGAWAALLSWKRHAGLPHILSLLTMVWAGVLLVIDILPASGWQCG